MICSACSDIIDKNDLHLRCNTDACYNYLHLSCFQNDNSAYKNVTSWICKECAYKANVNSDLSLACSQDERRDPNVTFRKKQSTVAAFNEDQNVIIGELTSEIRYLRQEVFSLSDQLSQAISSITCYHEKLELYSVQIAAMDEKLKKFGDNKQTDVCVIDPPQTCLTESVATTATSPAVSTVTLTTTKSAPRKKGKKSKSTRLPSVSTNAPACTLVSISEHNSQPQHVQTLPLQTPLTQLPPAPIQPDPNSIRNTTQSSPHKSVISEARLKKSNYHKWLSGTAGPHVTTLKAAEVRKYLHLWNMESNADDVRDYLKQLCPSGTCTVDELRPKGNYRSYKIGIPVDDFDTCFSIDVWPINAKIKSWIPYRKRKDFAVSLPSTSQSQHNFRA